MKFLAGVAFLIVTTLGGVWGITTYLLDREHAALIKTADRLDRVTDPADGYSKAIGTAITDLKQTLQASLDRLSTQVQQQGDSLKEISANTAATAATLKQMTSDMQDVRADMRQVRDTQGVILQRVSLNNVDPLKDYFGYVTSSLKGTEIDPKRVGMIYAAGQIGFYPVADYASIASEKFKQAGWKAYSVGKGDVIWLKPPP